MEFSRKASRASVYKVVSSLPPAATSRLASHDRYCKAFQVYDLKQVSDRNGDKASWTDIGRQVLPEDFKKIKQPFVDENPTYKKFRMRIKDLYDLAKQPIGIVSGSPVEGLHFAQPTRCHPTTLNACYHVVLWCLSTCEMP